MREGLIETMNLLDPVTLLPVKVKTGNPSCCVVRRLCQKVHYVYHVTYPDRDAAFPNLPLTSGVLCFILGKADAFVIANLMSCACQIQLAAL